VSTVFAKVLPERAQAKMPVLAARARVGAGSSQDNVVSAMCAWLFCWRDGASWRALVRLPADELRKALSAAVKTAVDGDDGE
jgi:hypothetical protein